MRFLRRLFGLMTLVGVAVGTAVVLRRRFLHPHERVDVYFADGAMAALEAGDAEAEEFFVLARDGVEAVRAL